MAALVLDSNVETRNLASALLEEVGLYVVECPCARSALETLNWTARDTILVMTDDARLGDIYGIAFAREANEKWPWISVLIQSSDPNPWPGMPSSTIFISKPWFPMQVLIEAERAVDAARNFR
jgi:DNA-binding NtrC family response regulator